MARPAAAAAAVAVLCLCRLTSGEYLDRRQDDVYRRWRGLQYGCRCDPVGSVTTSCDIITGQCRCWPNVTGASCDRCQTGYFDLRPGVGCRACDCDPLGSVKNACDPITGQCRCKAGVGGEMCSACLPGYFRLSLTGCQECGPCDQPGRRCDPDTGQCTCPPNTVGSSCQRCAHGYWARHPIQGCKPCSCSQRGSVSDNCDPWTGRCDCFFGFGSRSCDQCARGYFGFPRCRRCQCDPAGTEDCDTLGTCPCDRDGRCRCKRNTVGERCDQCAVNTFGLSADNPDGCTACFCFTRSGQCSQAEFSWTPLHVVETNRTVVLEYDETAETYETLPVVPWNTEEICYIHLTLPDDRAVTLAPGQTRLNVTNSLRVIPGHSGDVRLGLSFPFDAPIYWQLPPEFLGDKIRSYNGELRFRIQNSGGSREFPDSILASYPLVQLQGNDRLVLEYYPETTPTEDGLYQVRFHEALWRRKGDPVSSVSREMLMVALQNTQHVLIRATELLDVERAEISEVSWDVAEPTFGRPGAPALGVEKCACPQPYNGTSCQDPSIGFYRTYRQDYQSSQVIIDLVGEAVPCQCSGRAVTCDRETGRCLNCSGNTGGPRCDVCADGYYGNPLEDGCRRCLCPSLELQNGLSCVSFYRNTFRCQCKPGYTGERCDRCSYGYYGDARDPAVGCVSCGCDPAGSVSSHCQPDTGQCYCRPGVSGRTCTGCEPRHAFTDRGCQECRDGCVELLFEEVEELNEEVTTVNVSSTVGAPWRRLYQINNQSEEYQQYFTDYIETQLSLKALYDTLDFTKFANTIIIRAEGLIASLPNIINDSREVQDQIRAINESLQATMTQAEETVKQLRRYSLGETSSTTVSLAVAEASAILEQLQKRDFSSARQRADAELAAAGRLLERIRALRTNGTVQLAALTRLEAIRARLLEMQELVESQARRPTRKAEALLKEVQKSLETLSEAGQQVLDHAGVCEELLANGTVLQVLISRLYDQAQGHVIDLEDITLELRTANVSLQRRLSSLSDLTDDYRVRYVIPAEVHADRLMKQAVTLSNLFQATRQEANLSLNAAQAYQKIVDALSAAREAAEDADRAAQLAYRQAYPRDTDSLVSLGTQAKTTSEQLRNFAGSLRDQVTSLSEKLAVSKERLQKVNETLKAAGNANDDVRKQLEALDTAGARRSAEEAARRSQLAQERANDALRRLQDVQSAVQGQLRPGLRRLEVAATGTLDSAISSVDKARMAITKSDLLALDVESNATDVEELSDSVGQKLKDLKKKILKARQAASNIRVSLSAAAGRPCVRTYRAVHLQPSTTSSVRLVYAVSEPAARDALLFYLASRTQKDFLAIEMVNRKIRFLWNNGGETQTVEHPLSLRTSDEELVSYSNWYIIHVNRTGNVGHLSVRPVLLAGWEDPEPVSDASTAGFSVLDLAPDDPVFIGGLPAGAQGRVTAKRFAGCLDRVVFDGQPLGLWNFRTSQGCTGCRVGPSEDELATSPGHSFDGAGYAELPQLPQWGQSAASDTFSVLMKLRSFDSDALLFLAANAGKDQFFSIELRDGRLVARFGFNRESVLVVTSNRRYNNGNWTSIEATQHRRQAILKVNDDENKEGYFNPESGSRALPTSFSLDLDESKLYFGGVSPDFDQSRWQMVTFIPFLGCMDSLQVGSTTQNLKDGNSTGVTMGCNGQLLRMVGFHGNGYLEMNSYRLKKTSNFGFSFKTTASDGLLLMSTFTGKVPDDSPDLREYYMIGLSGGRLTLRINGGSTEKVFETDGTFNDGRYHPVHVLKKRRKIEVRVADEVVVSGQLNRGSSVVAAPERGGLFFGGLPPDVQPKLDDLPPSFQGSITDVIFDDQLVLFDAPLRYQNVAIGRDTGDLLRERPPQEMATEPEAASCNRASQVTLEAGALKFGDDPFSYMYVPVNKTYFRRNFNITLDFRTFYPNGLLLYNEGSSRRRVSSLLLSLRDGSLVLNVQRGPRKRELRNPVKLNDGNWKMVTLEKQGRKYVLRVRGSPPVSRLGPGRLRGGRALYIGGVPREKEEKLEQLQTEGFKGCIKQLEIRGRAIDLPSLMINTPVSQCKAHVELGALFAGDAYATYDNSFQLRDNIELALDFRTTKRSGVLISVAGPPGGPAMSLEITDGQVVFSVYNGGTQPIRAREKFPDKFAVCDNRWHTVKANYVRYQVTLKVDRYPERYGVSADGTSRISSGGFPLYIGGLPESDVNAILLQPDNFQGCIRNIEINGVRRDWTDMAGLTKVLLNSCPVES